MKLKNDDHHKRSCIQNTQRILYGQLLFVMTFLAVIIGFEVGFGIREARPSEDVIHWIGMPGDLFMRSLKMMIVPLIVTSVINSTASLDPKSNGRVGMISITYIFFTNMMGCLIAITLVYIIKPGRINLQHDKKVMVSQIQPQDIFADLLRNIIPDNLVEATFRKTQTKSKPGIVRMEPKNLGNVTNDTADVKQTMEMVKNVGKSDGPNILGLILACMFIGIAAGRFSEKAKTFLNFFEISAEIVLQILRWFIWLTPVGVASLIAASFAGTRDVSETFISLGYFVLTVTLGILFIQAILLPLIYYALIRKNPFYNTFCIKRAWLMGFSFASSILTTLSSFSLPGLPSASLVALVMVLSAISVPVHEVSLLFAVEWFLDRLRTGANVESHFVCAAVTNHFCKRKCDLKEENVENNPEPDIEIIVQSDEEEYIRNV